MKTYENYKDSGIEWIGEIPEHWEVKRLKYVSQINKNTLSENTNEDYEFNYIEVGNVDQLGNINATDKYKFKDSPSRARRIVNEGDVIISTVRTYLRAITSIDKNHEKDIVSTGFAVIHPTPTIINQYLKHFSRSEYFIQKVVSLSQGVSYPATTATEISEIKVVIPITKEQTQIANYLDYKISLIDKLIEKNEKLIELLEEKRSAIINQAVTKGLNPDVKMKDSGIEWIGEIPEHWDIEKIKYFSSLITQGPNPNYNIGEPINNYRVLKTKDLYDDGIRYLQADNISIETFKCKKNSELKDGDFLIAIVGKGSIGKNNIFNNRYDDIKFIYTRALGLIRTLSNIQSKLLYYFFQSKYGKEIINLGIDGSTGQEIIKTTYLKEIKFMFPTNLKEQNQIVDYLNKRTSQIDKLVGEKRKSNEYLKEYRTTLISNVVTGKVDVRDEKTPESIN